MNFHQYLVSWLQHCEDTATCFISSGQCTIQLLLYIYSSSCWILHDFHRMVQRIKADMLLTWDVGFVELVQHQQVELVGVGVAHHAGHGHDGVHRLTEGHCLKAGVSLDILCNCSIMANNNLNINIDTWTPVDSYLIKNWTQTHNQKLTSPYCHFGPSLPPYNWLTIDHCIITELC